MKFASSDARNNAAFATSQGVPILWRSGTRASRAQQANEQHVGLIEVAGLLGLAAQFFIHAQTLGQKGAPFVGLIFDRFDFKTSAARLVHKAGGSLRDVQLLAGHRSPRPATTNGNRIDDRQSCTNVYCQIRSHCDRITLNNTK
jgi:hypothetical protein